MIHSNSHFQLKKKKIRINCFFQNTKLCLILCLFFCVCVCVHLFLYWFSTTILWDWLRQKLFGHYLKMGSMPANRVHWFIRFIINKVKRSFWLLSRYILNNKATCLLDIHFILSPLAFMRYRFGCTELGHLRSIFLEIFFEWLTFCITIRNHSQIAQIIKIVMSFRFYLENE